MTYVFDTSALIGAWVRTYPPDVMPGLWDHLDELASQDRLHAPEEVLQEISSQDDDLAAWVHERAGKIIVPSTRAVLLEARSVLADHPKLTMLGKGRGLADPFVIALASIKGCHVVTHEQGGSIDKPRIPFVCQDRQVPSMDVLGVIRAEGLRFTR